ncbi:hypothetical protein GCM10010350_76090 [Streptomyces galilaeus]|nr:hypothetical protein GCM10010350_76090 [Streptomyces galilaeus]
MRSGAPECEELRSLTRQMSGSEFVPQPFPPTESALRGTQEPQESGLLRLLRPIAAAAWPQEVMRVREDVAAAPTVWCWTTLV